MNKQAVLTIVLLSVAGYSYAEEKQQEAVTVTFEVRVDKDIVADVVEAAKEDAKALKEKYETVCGIEVVRSVVTQNTKEEEITRSCSSSCSCKCKSCSSGSCCKCRSVQIEDEACCQEHQISVETRAGCEACQKIKEGNARKREQATRHIQEELACASCSTIIEKCESCGNVSEEFRCACGKPKTQDGEDLTRCNCGKPKPSDVQQ